MSVSAAQVKELREKSGAGMMDCKKALAETGGDIEAAIDWLRKKGLAAAAKKAGRAAAEGLVGVYTQGTEGVLVELNSETDFVARNEQFQELVATLSRLALETKAENVDALKKAAYPNTGRNVEEEITHAISVIGENMDLRRTARLSVNNGVVAQYVHNAVKPGMGKIGVIVALESDAPEDALHALGKQIAMHIAAAKPDALTVEEVDPANLERERQVLKDQALASGKPENIVEKMIDGRIRKYYEEVVLLEQLFVIDGKSKVKDIVAEAAKDAGAAISVTGYRSFVLGEGVEKEEGDFASEVAAAAGQAA